MISFRAAIEEKLPVNPPECGRVLATRCPARMCGEKQKTSPGWRGLTPLVARPEPYRPRMTGLALPPCWRQQVGGHVVGPEPSVPLSITSLISKWSVDVNAKRGQNVGLGMGLLHVRYEHALLAVAMRPQKRGTSCKGRQLFLL